MSKFDLSLYDDAFYKWHYQNVHESCYSLGYVTASYYKIKSLVDIGCGIGSFLQGAKDCGVERVKGYDIGGEHAKKYADKSIVNNIDFNTDITKGVSEKDQYEVCLCLEVAEHLDSSNSEKLISTISTLTEKICIFTAADIGQDGTGHINLKSKDFWIKLFEDNGFYYSENETENMKTLWYNAPDYYLKNLMVFLKTD